MRIVLYKNKAEAIKVDKTDDLSFVMEALGTLRDNADLNNPVVTIDKLSLDQTQMISAIVDDVDKQIVDDDGYRLTGDDITYINCNYAYIEELNRYYFIESVTLINSRLFSFSMHEDVLYTHKESIKKMRALVSRNEYDYNADMYDGELLTKADLDVSVTKHLNQMFGKTFSDTATNFVITTVSEV